MMPTKEEYKWYKAHHICPVCRKNRAAPNRVSCDDCLEKDRIKSQNRRKRKEATDALNKYKRETYKKRKEEGLCTVCGKKKSLYTQTCCYECTIKRRRAKIRSYNNLKPDRTGLCKWCDNKALPEKIYCAYHYEVLCKQIADGRKAIMHKTFKKQNNAFWMSYKGGDV